MQQEKVHRLAEPAITAADPLAGNRIAVLLPCLNEAAAIAKVVEDFRAALPGAQVYVFDNASTDDTGAVAAAAGAQVRREPRPGKGHVVRRMFADVEADVYVIADGDGTYDASAAPAMVQMLIADRLDMVVGLRDDLSQETSRAGHELGNILITGFLNRFFGARFGDTLSGYRVMSRRFVKTFPCLSDGFEIETEMAVHTVTLALPFGEVHTAYGARPDGSASKLRTFRDGARILRTMVNLLRQEKPALFFGAIGLALALLALVLAWPLGVTYWNTGLVPRMPTAVLCTGLMISALLTWSCGVILDSTARGRTETRRLAYLNWRAPEGR
ncbi:MAG TPA: glycosyltransferase [Caulobacteraceae bacterium]